MRKKRFDPSYLEPKDGDFAGFVENPHAPRHGHQSA